MDWLILIVMLVGLATIAVGLAMVWQPLAVLYAGLAMCAIAVSAYVHSRKETRR